MFDTEKTGAMDVALIPKAHCRAKIHCQPSAAGAHSRVCCTWNAMARWQVFKVLNFELASADAKKMMKDLELEAGEAAGLSFEGFVALFEARQANLSAADIARVHRSIAEDKGGELVVTKESLKANMVRLGMPEPSPEQLENMIREIAVGGMSTDADDNSVSLDEFHNLIQHRVSDPGVEGGRNAQSPLLDPRCMTRADLCGDGLDVTLNTNL